MPTVLENREAWTDHLWMASGDEWSDAWGGTPYLWSMTIYPRIISVLPANHILEIAPGFGRCTQYLLHQCKQISIVDVTEKCLEHCKKRFEHYSHIEYVLNDGISLREIPDSSVDFVFSWDSLVHAEDDVIRSYLFELSDKLRPGGYGFIHHSNFACHRDEKTCLLSVENPAWRGSSVTAESFRKHCENAGLGLISQEIISWAGIQKSDCLSFFYKKRPYEAAIKPNIFVNEFFDNEVLRAREISGQYSAEKRFAGNSFVPPLRNEFPIRPLAVIMKEALQIFRRYFYQKAQKIFSMPKDSA